MSVEIKSFESRLQAAVMREVEAICEEEAKTAAVKVEQRVKSMTAQIAATVVRRMSFEAYGPDALKIIVEFPKQ